jgi:Protein of unknown function (DUF3309)
VQAISNLSKKIVFKNGVVMYATAHRRSARRFRIGNAEPCSESVAAKPTEENQMGIGTILLVILVLALVGVIPTWPHSKGWGYGPSGGVGLILVIVLILFVLGKI